MRRLRAPILVMSVLLFSVNAAGYQASAAGAVGGPDPALLQWAVTQGGLVLVVLAVVWSYRRDFLRVFNVERERTDMLLEVVKQATQALATHSETAREQAGAARAQAEAFAKVAHSIQMCEAVREMVAERGA